MMSVVDTILHYVIIFSIVFFASLLAHTMSMLIIINKMVNDLSSRVGYNYQKGRNEYVNDQEKAYRRKQV